jgi:hypothetical protein
MAVPLPMSPPYLREGKVAKYEMSGCERWRLLARVMEGGGRRSPENGSSPVPVFLVATPGEAREEARCWRVFAASVVKQAIAVRETAEEERGE